MANFKLWLHFYHVTLCKIVFTSAIVSFAQAAGSVDDCMYEGCSRINKNVLQNYHQSSARILKIYTGLLRVSLFKNSQ